MRHDPKIELLRSVPVLAEASLHDLRDLAAAGDTVDLEPGRFLQRAAHHVGDAWLVLRGEVTLVADGFELAALHPGDLLGELEVVDGGPAATDAVAAMAVTALVLTAPRLRGLVESNHAVRTVVVRQLARRARELAPAV